MDNQIWDADLSMYGILLEHSASEGKHRGFQLRQIYDPVELGCY